MSRLRVFQLSVARIGAVLFATFAWGASACQLELDSTINTRLKEMALLSDEVAASRVDELLKDIPQSFLEVVAAANVANQRVSTGKVVRTHMERFPEDRPAARALGFDLVSESVNLTVPELRQYVRAAILHFVRDLKEGRIGADEVILPAWAYRDLETGKYVYKVPGFDPWPDSQRYKLVLELERIEHEEWVGELSRGRMPSSLGGFFFFHDLFGHYLEFVRDPEFMSATRAHQVTYESLGLDGVDWKKFKLFENRNIWAAEILVLVTPEAAKLVSTTTRETWSDELHEEWKRVLRPVGAGVRDLSIQDFHQTVVPNAIFSLIHSKAADLQVAIDDVLAPANAQSHLLLNSPLGVLAEAELMMRWLNDPFPVGERVATTTYEHNWERFTELVQNEFTREYVLRCIDSRLKKLRLLAEDPEVTALTSVRVMRDIAELEFDWNSPTGHFIRNSVAPHTRTRVYLGLPN